MTYEEENNELLRSYMERNFFASWRASEKAFKDPNSHLGNFHSLELGLNPYCDLECKYCYMAKFKDEYYPKDTRSNEKILHNCKLLFNWLDENKMSPNIELFSGDPFVQTIGFDVLELLLEYIRSGKKIAYAVTVPTNMSVLLHPEKKVRLQALIENYAATKVPLYLSASVDGKFMEENRPHRNPKHKYDDAFYHELFTWAKKYNFGFHPMIYSGNIDKWIDNFLWFQSKYEEYGIDWRNMYLLEIRNQEWTEEQTLHLYKFIKFLVHWSWEKCGKDPKRFGFASLFNIIAGPISRTGRGIGCSIQSSIQTRMGDLTWALCHRLMYDKFIAGQFDVKDDKIIGVSARNFEAWLGINSSTTQNFPYCETCLIKTMCNTGCLGSNFETTGDPFTTPPTVCKLEHIKVYGIFEALKEIGQLPYIVSIVNDDRRPSVIEFLKFTKLM